MHFFLVEVIKQNKTPLRNGMLGHLSPSFLFLLVLVLRACHSLCSIKKKPEAQVLFDAKPSPQSPSTACLASVSPTHYSLPS